MDLDCVCIISDTVVDGMGWCGLEWYTLTCLSTMSSETWMLISSCFLSLDGCLSTSNPGQSVWLHLFTAAFKTLLSGSSCPTKIT